MGRLSSRLVELYITMSRSDNTRNLNVPNWIFKYLHKIHNREETPANFNLKHNIL